MVKFTQFWSKTFKATFCILLLALSFNYANSARILDEVSSDEPVVAPVVVGPVSSLPSGHFPATITTPDSNVTPIDDDSPEPTPTVPIAPSADLPAGLEPDVAPTAPVATNTGAAPPVAPAAPVATDTGITGPVAPAAPVVPDTEAAIPVTNVAPGIGSSGATVANPVLDHSKFSFFMHDILGGTHPSGRVVTGIVASTDVNNLPFTKANDNVFPLDGGVPLNNINDIVNNNNYPFLAGLNGQQPSTVLQNTGNNDIVNTGDNQPFVTAGQLPSGITLQQLMFGSITVVDNEITEGHELGSSILGRAQGFYLTSSSDGTSHTLALTTLFHGEHGHEVDDTISFFGIHRTATPISHIAIIGGTGKYENAKGYATIETMPHVDQHTTDGLETITHFTVYITP